MDKWFFRQVYQWRVWKSAIWTASVIPGICIVHCCLCNLSLFHPFDWLIGFATDLFSFSFIFKVILSSLFISALSMYSVTQFKVTPDVAINRLEYIYKLLKVPVLAHACAYCLSGAVITWCLVKCLSDDFSVFSYSPNKNWDVLCINEHHLFVVLSGLYFGLIYHVMFIINQENYLQFESVQQGKVFQLKNRSPGIIFKSVAATFRKLKYFYLLYFIFGHIPRNWIVYNLRFDTSCRQPLNTVWGMLDLSLLWQTYLCGLFLHVSWSIGAAIFKIAITERYVFHVESIFDEYHNRCLVDALMCDKQRFIQYIGFYDLSELSRHSPERRTQLFSLSQPGGHPYNWTKISAVCLSELESLHSQVQQANWKVFANVPVKKPSGDTLMKNSNTTAVNGSSVSFRGDGNASTIYAENIPSQQTELKKPSRPGVSQKISDYLKKKPLFGYFLNEIPESESRKLFASCQIHIWILDALSNLIASSFKEDQFGVVQRTLPEILIAVLNLQEVVDKHFKVAANTSRRGQKETYTAKDSSLRFSLQTSLKTCIYRIINTFGKSLVELRLPYEVESKLKLFMDYKE